MIFFMRCKFKEIVWYVPCYLLLSRFQVPGSRFHVPCSRFRVPGSGFQEFSSVISNKPSGSIIDAGTLGTWNFGTD
jgi:hypothetical protein